MTRSLQATMVSRRRMLCACCAGTALGFVPWRAIAAPEAVAAADEPHHHVIFANADLRIMRVMIPPGEGTGWHRHAHDFVVTVLRGTMTRTEQEGEDRAALGEMVTDAVLFASYEDKPIVHRVYNTSTWLNHQLAFEILAPKPGGYGKADRTQAPAFAMILDNPRLRAWRLKLQPGTFTPRVTQDGPGLRVILAGDRMIDTPDTGAANETDIRAGDAAFLPPDTRSITNAGSSPLDIVEFELR